MCPGIAQAVLEGFPENGLLDRRVSLLDRLPASSVLPDAALIHMLRRTVHLLESAGLHPSIMPVEKGARIPCDHRIESESDVSKSLGERIN